ncbi:hypothetical protein FOZ62_013357, partial [Perkinsus olseni]
YEADDFRSHPSTLQCDPSGPGWSWKDPHGPLRCVKREDFCAPPSGNFSEVVNSTEGLRIGSSLIMQCRHGYVPYTGYSQLTCTSSCGDFGIWNREPLSCVPSIVAPERPTVSSLGARAKVECELGYTAVVGVDVSYPLCGYNQSGEGGAWLQSDNMTPVASGEPFRCVPTDDWCPEMPLIPSFASVIDVSEGRRLGSMAWLACNHGYIYESGDSSVVCGSNASAKGE